MPPSERQPGQHPEERVRRNPLKPPFNVPQGASRRLPLNRCRARPKRESRAAGVRSSEAPTRATAPGIGSLPGVRAGAIVRRRGGQGVYRGEKRWRHGALARYRQGEGEEQQREEYPRPTVNWPGRNVRFGGQWPAGPDDLPLQSTTVTVIQGIPALAAVRQSCRPGTLSVHLRRSKADR
jgi:hypothetical protein